MPESFFSEIAENMHAAASEHEDAQRIAEEIRDWHQSTGEPERP